MDRLVVAASVTLLTACDFSLGGPASAQFVAQNDSDFPGLHLCPQSGSYDSVIKSEASKDPARSQSDQQYWNQLKASGANDSYLAVYGTSTADCSTPSANNQTEKGVFVLAIRYKDTGSATANFKSEADPLHVGVLAFATAAGGIAQQGSATGLGDNSVVWSDAGGSVNLFRALWESKQFLVQVYAEGISNPAALAATKKINGRIH